MAGKSVEAQLRDLSFGYRARFLQQSAKQILDTHGVQWLDGLRTVSYMQARDALRSLPGVGTKVELEKAPSFGKKVANMAMLASLVTACVSPL